MACNCNPYILSNSNGCLTVTDEATGTIVLKGNISCARPSSDGQSVLVDFQGGKSKRFHKDCLVGGDSISDNDFTMLFCPCSDLDPPFEFVSVSHFDLCLNGSIVKFEACKDETGVTVYTGSDGSAFGSYAEIFAAGYTTECVEKEYLCTEVVYPISNDEVVTYQNLLDYANNNASFDDGSTGAEGINFVMFGNAFGLLYTYNGTTKNLTGSQYFGSPTDYNPVSLDLEIVGGGKGENQITYNVYKCI